jgi:hypothetical protein
LASAPTCHPTSSTSPPGFDQPAELAATLEKLARSHAAPYFIRWKWRLIAPEIKGDPDVILNWRQQGNALIEMRMRRLFPGSGRVVAKPEMTPE